MIKNSLFATTAALVLCCALALPAVAAPASSAKAAPAPSGGAASSQIKTAEVDGLAWKASTNDAKLSFLLGVENAIAMEYALSQAQAKEQGKEPLALSPFQAGWMIAFQNTSRQQVVDGIDAFYAGRPNESGRHVFDVVWTEMITPALPTVPAAAGK